MKVNYTVDKFDPRRGLVYLRETRFGGVNYCIGDTFFIPPGDKSIRTRARQLYETRKLGHLDTFLASMDVDADMDVDVGQEDKKTDNIFLRKNTKRKR